MDEWIDKSEFYHFGILPQVCIHSLIEDEYSKMYIPRDKCECGSNEWIESSFKLIEDFLGHEFPKKKVNRCKKCNEIRMADHIAIKEER